MIGLVDGNNFFVSCERVFNRRLVGRPVAVLSNNDGCCIARSNEFKALGIAMGTPYYQLKSREKSGELDFCSSNYELYGDMCAASSPSSATSRWTLNNIPSTKRSSILRRAMA